MTNCMSYQKDIRLIFEGSNLRLVFENLRLTSLNKTDKTIPICHPEACHTEPAEVSKDRQIKYKQSLFFGSLVGNHVFIN